MDFNHENSRTEMQINKCMLCTQNYIIRQQGRKFQYFNKFDYWYIFHEIKKIFFHILFHNIYHIYTYTCTCIHKFIQQHCIHALFLTLWQTDHAFQAMCSFLLSEIKEWYCITYKKEISLLCNIFFFQRWKQRNLWEILNFNASRPAFTMARS